MAKEKDSKQETNPGIFVMAGEIEASEFDNLDWREQIQDYTSMRNGDGIISTSLTGLKLPIERSNYRINPGQNTEIAIEAAKYIEWQFDNLVGGFQIFRWHCLLALDYGLSLFEKIYKRAVTYFNGKKNKTTNIISRFSPIENGTIYQFLYDENANFTGIIHERRIPEGNTENIPINKEKLFRLTYKEEYNDVRGRSILRPVREAWNYRKKVLTATARASQRGAGIPIATVYGDLTPASKSNAEKMLRTLGNAENAYVIEQKEKIEVRLEELKTQSNNIPLLEILNREIFFNSLTQFMTSGLGQSGSRAATAELKSTYELAASSIQQWLEEAMQRITNEMIDISYLANIKKEDRPIFSFDSISQVDLNRASVDIKNLLDSGAVTKDQGLEKFVRSLFDYPEQLKADTSIAVEESKEADPTEIQEDQLEHKYKNIELSDQKKKNFERMMEIFELESANKHFLNVQAEGEKILDDMTDKIINDIVIQLKGDRNKPVQIKQRFTVELTERLQDLYDKGVLNGFNDFIKELTKITKKGINLNRVNLAGTSRAIKKGLQQAVNSFGIIIKTRIENRMDMLSDEYIVKAGGVENVIRPVVESGIKGQRRNIITATESGYTAGRGEALLANKEIVSDFIYTSVLDEGLCEECGQYTSDIFTLKELTESGFNLFQPINPDCLGSGKCRCQWVANTAEERAANTGPVEDIKRPEILKPTKEAKKAEDVVRTPEGNKLPRGVLERSKENDKNL